MVGTRLNIFKPKQFRSLNPFEIRAWLAREGRRVPAEHCRLNPFEIRAWLARGRARGYDL